MNGELQRAWLYRVWWIAALVGYLLLACHQLGLPGLHYDEAREAGVNAMELLTGAPVTAFRDAALQIGALRLPLMVQDYIGALNVYLALPILGISGIGVPNLRLLGVLLGLCTLLVLERSVTEWLATRRTVTAGNPPLGAAGLCAMTLAALSPAFVFWSRQGIFVTNSMILFTMLALWMGVRWLRTGENRAFVLAAFFGSMALYAKLLAVWVLLPFAAMAGIGYWLFARRGVRPALPLSVLLWGILAFALPLLPLLLFNLQTGGTWQALTGNLGQSYYGVENANVLGNLGVRLPQVGQVLAGSFLWYLGGLQSNPLAPWVAVMLVAAGLLADWRRVLPPLLLALAAFALSLVTISDLFITHYALLQVVILAVVGVAVGALVGGLNVRSSAYAGWGKGIVACAVVLWLLLDLRATLGYHRLLAVSGGLADHSDATYHLAYYLRYNGMGAPIALDWGMDAPVRFLTEGTVTPIEIFGYDSPAAPDEEYVERLAHFVANPDNVYLLHAPRAEVFRGRREQFEAAAAAVGMRPALEISFGQRDGTPLYEIWRLEPTE